MIDTLFPPAETTPLVSDLLSKGSPVAIGVSGGKDSTITAFVTQAYLQSIGHTGPVILIHSDLGRVEHKDSFRSGAWCFFLSPIDTCLLTSLILMCILSTGTRNTQGD